MHNINDIKQCVACFACVDSCPTGCIQIGNNQWNEKVVIADESSCINCKRCLSVCQNYGNILQCDEYREKICFAIQSKSVSATQNDHSSGGAAYEFAKYIIQLGGVVAGVRWGDCFEAEYSLTNRVDELKYFFGSKYVHSNAKGIYKAVLDKLQQQTLVLFVGLPCHVSALKHYLEAHSNITGRLFTIDLVCHGCPPGAYLQEYINYLHLDEAEDIRFRGEKDFCFSAFDKEHNTLYEMPADRDLYFKAFMNGAIYRENCYSCKYANMNRVGDLTLGDFWGLDLKQTNIQFKGRVSLCVVNSNEGEELLGSISESLLIEMRQLQEAINENRQLQEPTRKTKDFYLFRASYSAGCFVKALRNTETAADVKRNNIKYKKLLIKMAIKKGLGMT